MSDGGWLPMGFAPPPRLDIGDYHLRPIREDDVGIDYPAVMDCQPRLWALFGKAWGWPNQSMTREQDRVDLARHEAEAASLESFNYALWDADESHLLGCVYIDPPQKAGADAEISWWLHNHLLGTDLEASMSSLLREWLQAEWPFALPRLIGDDVTWDEWLTLPDLE